MSRRTCPAGRLKESWRITDLPTTKQKRNSSLLTPLHPHLLLANAVDWYPSSQQHKENFIKLLSLKQRWSSLRVSPEFAVERDTTLLVKQDAKLDNQRAESMLILKRLEDEGREYPTIKPSTKPLNEKQERR
jgi:hypothetical protein